MRTPIRPPFLPLSLGGFFLLSLCAAGGCSTFELGQQGLLGLGRYGRADQEPIAAGDPLYTIEIRRQGQRPQQVQVPLAEAITVQDAIEKVKAFRRFRRMDVRVVRCSAESDGRTHNLKVNCDRSKRRVSVDTNYALRGGDRLVIVEDTSTMLDDFVDRFGAAMGRRRR